MAKGFSFSAWHLSAIVSSRVHRSQPSSSVFEHGSAADGKSSDLDEGCGLQKVFCIVPHRVRTVLEGLWKLGRNGIRLSRPWKSVKTEWSLWKFVNFAIFRVLGKTYQLICQKLHFPRPNSSLNKTVCCAKSERTHLSVLTSATVRVAPLY